MSSVHAFEWCDCVFESAFGVQSLHASKAGAYRAMRSRLFREAEDARNGQILHGVYGSGYKHLEHQAWRVRTIEVSQ